MLERQPTIKAADVAGPSSPPDSPREEFLRRSIEDAGFGNDRARREAWLRILDLAHLEVRLPAIVEQRKTTKEGNAEEGISLFVDEEEATVALDHEGWQVASYDKLDGRRRASRIDGKGESDEDHEEADGVWSVARSRRRRRRQPSTTSHPTTMSRSSTLTTTSFGGGPNDAATTDEDGEGEGIAETNSASRESLKAERKARKRLKKKRRQAGDDLSASMVHVRPSTKPASTPPHRDEEQVALDVRRSFITLGQTKLRDVRRAELSRVVNGVLLRHPALHYYQGYHDVVSVLLSVMIPRRPGDDEEPTISDDDALDAVVDVACRVSLHYLRDAMTRDMTPTLGHLKLLRDILRRSDAADGGQLARCVEHASPLPYFALPWLLSLFAHDVTMEVSCRVFDFVLPRGPASVLYLSAALIARAPVVDEAVDAAELHHALSQLPANALTFANLPSLMQKAAAMAESAPLLDTAAQKAVGTGVMGRNSALYTWPALFKDDDDDDWSKADGRADFILNDDAGLIVINALPTPPPSDVGGDEVADGHIRDDKALVIRRWWRAPSDGKQRKTHEKQGALLAWVGAVGAVSAALIIIYGSSTTSSSSGLGTAFPIGLRAAEPLRALLRQALP